MTARAGFMTSQILNTIRRMANCKLNRACTCTCACKREMMHLGHGLVDSRYSRSYSYKQSVIWFQSNLLRQPHSAQRGIEQDKQSGTSGMSGAKCTSIARTPAWRKVYGLGNDCEGRSAAVTLYRFRPSILGGARLVGLVRR